MTALITIILSFAGILFLYIIYYILKGFRDKNRLTPDDMLRDLDFKISYSVIDNHSELYLINQIKEYRQNPDIDKERLDILNVKFVRRFAILHE